MQSTLRYWFKTQFILSKNVCYIAKESIITIFVFIGRSAPVITQPLCYWRRLTFHFKKIWNHQIFEEINLQNINCSRNYLWRNCMYIGADIMRSICAKHLEQLITQDNNLLPKAIHIWNILSHKTTNNFLSTGNSDPPINHE